MMDEEIRYGLLDIVIGLVLTRHDGLRLQDVKADLLPVLHFEFTGSRINIVIAK